MEDETLTNILNLLQGNNVNNKQKDKTCRKQDRCYDGSDLCQAGVRVLFVLLF